MNYEITMEPYEEHTLPSLEEVEGILSRYNMGGADDFADQSTDEPGRFIWSWYGMKWPIAQIEPFCEVLSARFDCSVTLMLEWEVTDTDDEQTFSQGWHYVSGKLVERGEERFIWEEVKV